METEYPSMSIANIVIPVSFGISCIATVLTIIFTIVLIVYYNKIKNFECEKNEPEPDDDLKEVEVVDDE